MQVINLHLLCLKKALDLLSFSS